MTVATAAFTPKWRVRWRLGLVAYVTVSVVLLSGLADVEHALAVLTGLALLPVLRRHQQGPRHDPRDRTTHRRDVTTGRSAPPRPLCSAGTAHRAALGG